MINENPAAGLIDNPPRESLLGSVVILLAAGVTSIGMAVPKVPGIYVIAGLAVLLAAALSARAAGGVHTAIFGLLLFLLPHLGTPFRVWPLSLLAPILAYGIIVRCVPGLRRSVGWLKKGHLDRPVLLMVIGTVVIAAAALVAWVMIIKPDIGHHLAMMPRLPVWLYPFAGAGFAVLNAAMEETVFRGVIMEAIDSAVGATAYAVFLQAVPFAALHYLAGFPYGLLGFVMTLVYGVMLGIIRRLSRGMLAPFIAHIAADVTIFSIMAAVFFNT